LYTHLEANHTERFVGDLSTNGRVHVRQLHVIGDSCVLSVDIFATTVRWSSTMSTSAGIEDQRYAKGAASNTAPRKPITEKVLCWNIPGS
jgi:hypothetical protein